MQQERLSYASGPSTQPLLGMTIGEQFDQACQQYAEKEAIVSFHQNRRLTYRSEEHTSELIKLYRMK